ncbi:L-threonine 3-dehydrogenase [Clostridium fallax]|uniref:L-threonine 3-dehydrogenase n=1 Tax=Clostridium fallax TaxID=1533 RepID=A0A1M4TAC1_9CLOT|nr:L-threonine 3-dehydrogenase [Clostridium fallax]SHE41187.1 L-threonine 3-dehydrogenase [Clostridium fallax]SQB22665.1 L-threonine dehydrogenase [Clostridium fallax]
MKKILVTGSLGQIGSELVTHMRGIYGNDNVIASDIREMKNNPVVNAGPFEVLDVLDAKKMGEVAKKHNVDTIIHLAALLSAVAEAKPELAWNINMGGLFNALEVAKELNCKFFTPSSIGAFGPSTPKDNTPQDTIQRPQTMYGVTKVSGELLCDYYYKRFGVDTRGVRFPGLISYVAPPGGGTTDYAVDIYYKAIEDGKYQSYIAEGTYMDMMYMPDALNAIVNLLEADPSRLKHRNAFNITAMSFEPSQIAAEIRKHIPSFEMTYDVDPVRQAIADSWPNSIDCTAAKEEWGFKAKYDLSSMTVDMLSKLRDKLDRK